MSYEAILEDILKDFLNGDPSSIQIKSDSFLSDEPIPSDVLEGFSKEELKTRFVKDDERNYYWPTTQIDISILVNNEEYFFFTVQDKESKEINKEYSRVVDMDILQTAIKENDKDVESVIHKELDKYNQDIPDSILNVTVEYQFITKKVVMDAAKIVLKKWSKKFPQLSNLTIDFVK